ncbi:MAG: hypothetical protein ACI9XZ_001397, partial [Alphaproteobacteria bacterium]
MKAVKAAQSIPLPQYLQYFSAVQLSIVRNCVIWPANRFHYAARRVCCRKLLMQTPVKARRCSNFLGYGH